jgi:hypothetical protein
MGILELAGVYRVVLRAVFTTETWRFRPLGGGDCGRAVGCGCPETVPRRRISEGGMSEDGAQEDIASEDCF